MRKSSKRWAVETLQPEGPACISRALLNSESRRSTLSFALRPSPFTLHSPSGLTPAGGRRKLSPRTIPAPLFDDEEIRARKQDRARRSRRSGRDFARRHDAAAGG